MDCRDTLTAIRDRLRAGEKAEAVITSLVPATLDEAEAWGRRLPLWAEFTSEFGPQVVGIARVVTKQGLRTHRRTLDRDGLLIPGSSFCDLYKPPAGEPVAFGMEIEGKTVNVVYTPSYFRGGDHFQFTGPGTPPEPTPLSGTGHYSHFAPADAVAGMGGHAAYARAFADAGPERDKLFKAAFEGELPAAEKAVKGRHTARAVKGKPRRSDRPTSRAERRPCSEKKGRGCNVPSPSYRRHR